MVIFRVLDHALGILLSRLVSRPICGAMSSFVFFPGCKESLMQMKLC